MLNPDEFPIHTERLSNPAVNSIQLTIIITSSFAGIQMWVPNKQTRIDTGEENSLYLY